MHALTVNPQEFHQEEIEFCFPSLLSFTVKRYLKRDDLVNLLKAKDFDPEARVDEWSACSPASMPSPDHLWLSPPVITNTPSAALTKTQKHTGLCPRRKHACVVLQRFAKSV